jgi:opacity protein-like surface antigen
MKKMTYLFMSAAVAVSASSALAHNCCHMAGFYAGANIGYGSGYGKMSMDAFRVVDPDHNVKQLHHLGLSGFRGGVHIGYGTLFQNKFYLGVEGSADLSNTHGKSHVIAMDRNGDHFLPVFNFRARRRDSLGLAVRVGGMLGGMLAYAKVGVETARWRFDALQASYLGGGQAGRNFFSSIGQTKRLTGVVFGLGMETMLTDHIILGGEWVYTNYTKAPSLPLTYRTTAESLVFKFSPRTNDFRLRLSYKW